LTAQDLSMLWPDDVRWPQDIGALAILEAGGLFDTDGRFEVEAVREAIGARLHLVPRFRQAADGTETCAAAHFSTSWTAATSASRYSRAAANCSAVVGGWPSTTTVASSAARCCAGGRNRRPARSFPPWARYAYSSRPVFSMPRAVPRPSSDTGRANSTTVGLQLMRYGSGSVDP
jgi:hypothetical protein